MSAAEVYAPAESIEAIALFEEAFGARWRPGPRPGVRGIGTAMDVLVSDLKRIGGWQSPRHLPTPALRGATESPPVWRRQLSPAERSRRWVVSVDKHAAYLSVLPGLELGLGEPVRIDASGIDGMRDTRQPGYWRVRCAFPPAPELLPDPLYRPRVGDFWITTPTLELAIEQRCEVEILEAWVWPVHRRLLRPFAYRVNNARRALAVSPSPHAAEAREMLKDVYAPILGGFLARLADERKSPRPPWYRPDWRHHVIAKARANFLRMLYRGAYVACPIGLYNDAAYYATDQEPAELAARLGLLVHQLGGWSVGAARELAEVVDEHGYLNFALARAFIKP